VTRVAEVERANKHCFRIHAQAQLPQEVNTLIALVMKAAVVQAALQAAAGIAASALLRMAVQMHPTGSFRLAKLQKCKEGGGNSAVCNHPNTL
jgi:hypothetical protein